MKQLKTSKAALWSK